MKLSNFPYNKIKRFLFNPKIYKEKILDFKYLKFIENKENILFLCIPGVGKVYLDIYIGIEVT